MNTSLFADLPESPSPKLTWLRKHGLITKYDPELEACPESPETGETCHPWIVTQAAVMRFGRFTLGAGQTEDEAILDFCAKQGIPHYSLE